MISTHIILLICISGVWWSGCHGITCSVCASSGSSSSCTSASGCSRCQTTVVTMNGVAATSRACVPTCTSSSTGGFGGMSTSTSCCSTDCCNKPSGGSCTASSSGSTSSGSLTTTTTRSTTTTIGASTTTTGSGASTCYSCAPLGGSLLSLIGYEMCGAMVSSVTPRQGGCAVCSKQTTITNGKSTYIRKCATQCTPSSSGIALFGNAESVDCCTGDLCNSATYRTPSTTIALAAFLLSWIFCTKW